MAFPEGDREWREETITSVQDFGDGWDVACGGLHLIVPRGPVVPAPGMTLRTYGLGFGYPVRGAFVDGHEFYYRTPAEQARLHADWVAEKERKDQERLDAESADRDRRWAALPEPYRRRRARFAANNPTWRRDFEAYELFVCEQAHLIARTLRTRASVAAFAAAPWEEQLRLVPGLDGGHSGNTFGAACALAALEADRPEGVVQQHGALSPLVGSRDYGDLTPEHRVADALMEGE